jgi:Glycosyl transferase family 2
MANPLSRDQATEAPISCETLICIHTHNEGRSIDHLIDAILLLPVRVDIVIIDDDSTDGTREKVSRPALRRMSASASLFGPANSGLAPHTASAGSMRASSATPELLRWTTTPPTSLGSSSGPMQEPTSSSDRVSRRAAAWTTEVGVCSSVGRRIA